MPIADHLTTVYSVLRAQLEGNADWVAIFPERNRIWHDAVSPASPDVGYPEKTQEGDGDFPRSELDQGRMTDSFERPGTLTLGRCVWIEELVVVYSLKMTMTDFSLPAANQARMAALFAWRKNLPRWGLGPWLKRAGPAQSPPDQKIADASTAGRFRRVVRVDVTVVMEFTSQELKGQSPLRTSL